tara:strand:- start:7911 stop:8318 length:408 start_codon:yes stop_codon:yes gene_type:complete
MSFTSPIKDFNLQFIEGAKDTMRGTTIGLWKRIIKESPVLEGRFRANWFASGARPSSRVTPKKKVEDSEDKTLANATNKVLKQKDASAFTLTNNLPYAQRLEYGYSDQAPAGVVRVNVKRFNRLLEVEAKKKLPK